MPRKVPVITTFQCALDGQKLYLKSRPQASLSLQVSSTETLICGTFHNLT